jgi:hypothetical protein
LLGSASVDRLTLAAAEGAATGLVLDGESGLTIEAEQVMFGGVGLENVADLVATDSEHARDLADTGEADSGVRV